MFPSREAKYHESMSELFAEHPPKRWELAAKEEPAEKLSIRSDDPVGELDQPNVGSWGKKYGRAPPAQLGEDVEHGAPRAQNPPVIANDMHRVVASGREFWSHRRIRDGLIGLGVEAPRVIAPPDPGGNASSETAVAVPVDEISIAHRFFPSGWAAAVVAVAVVGSFVLPSFRMY
jgi:hypothetical protein